MDLAIVIIFILLVVAYIYFTKTKGGIGHLGEITVSLTLGKNKPDIGKFVINNFSFRDYNRTVQVDHILLTTKGLFVIETKNIKGKLYGNETMEYWHKYVNGKKYDFYSPIKQNYNHIKSIRNIFSKSYYFNSIVVIEYADIRKITSKTPVIGLNKLNKTIMKYFSKEDIYSVEEVNGIYNTLIERQKKDNVTESEHISNVENYIKNK